MKESKETRNKILKKALATLILTVMLCTNNYGLIELTAQALDNLDTNQIQESEIEEEVSIEENIPVEEENEILKVLTETTPEDQLDGEVSIAERVLRGMNSNSSLFNSLINQINGEITVKARFKFYSSSKTRWNSMGMGL